jgi:hypothetical protein
MLFYNIINSVMMAAAGLLYLKVYLRGILLSIGAFEIMRGIF